MCSLSAERVFLIFILLLSISARSQFSVSGHVFDNTTKEPLLGVSIFYDGTTIGTVTDENGYFELSTSKRITGNLIIDFLGYQTVILSEVKEGSLASIFLKEKPVELEEVVLLPDTWSRAKKLRIFRKEFLGSTKAGLRSKILNEDDIRLYYNANENKLYAFAKKPVLILNKYLGYKVTYNLLDFEVDFFKQDIGPPISKSTYLAGTLFFLDLNKQELNGRYVKHREKTYLGSGIQFMRSLAKQNLTESGFMIFNKGFQIDPKEVYSMETTAEGFTRVVQSEKKLSILFGGSEQSSILVTANPFFIDSYGNHTPGRKVLFGGKMGETRAGGLLPIDYGID